MAKESFFKLTDTYFVGRKFEYTKSGWADYPVWDLTFWGWLIRLVFIVIPICIYLIFK